ncbi:complex I subunit 5 family protein [Legionella londiniensis]|uniref:NADH-quinone oxidoreductase chain L n=2 Tax=Legionella londiniensis TaxID=45068 RepID=A0A0W0VU32_9GAMM|nr:proton-conducting transporter membrane subunit [Legionella londiniensis]KTD23206.1 NADH-quinone oxidoreductase chain L [Legionella londiniensis]STX93783.1 NADH-quinone oxidoreductase chain L [Legionella londiniensis]
MADLACFPLLCAFAIALVSLLSIKIERGQRLLHILGAVIYLLVSIYVFRTVQLDGRLVLRIGGYPSGFAISFLLDGFSSLMLLVTAVTVFATAMYSLVDTTIHKISIFYPAFWFMLCGVTGAFSTGDLFNLYVWFEVMIMASFVLMTLSHEEKVLQGTLYYIGLNILATLLMLLAISFLYGLSGTLDMYDMAGWFHDSQNSAVALPFIALLLVSLAIKSALFPYYFWLPDSYYLTSVTVGAIFAGLLTKVGIYTLMRTATLFFSPSAHFMEILLFVSCFTMLGGVFGAMTDFHIRRILSFHIVSQVGYMTLALAMSTTLALSAGIFYIVHHIIVKTNLFLIAGLISRYNGHVNLRKMGNFLGKKPLLAILFLIPALSLAGMPPFSGFWAKFLVLKSALAGGFWMSAVIALAVGFFTLYSMIKIWRYAFLQPAQFKTRNIPLQERMFFYLPIIFLGLITLFIGFFPETLYAVANAAAQALLQQE